MHSHNYVRNNNCVEEDSFVKKTSHLQSFSSKSSKCKLVILFHMTICNAITYSGIYFSANYNITFIPNNENIRRRFAT